MKEQALALAQAAANRGQALNSLREYLQALVLRSFHEAEAFRCVAFVGGTALRFLHGLPRFSEDLDFSLVSPDGYAGQAWMAKVKRDLVLAGFTPGFQATIEQVQSITLAEPDKQPPGTCGEGAGTVVIQHDLAVCTQTTAAQTLDQCAWVR